MSNLKITHVDTQHGCLTLRFLCPECRTWDEVEVTEFTPKGDEAEAHFECPTCTAQLGFMLSVR